MIIDFPNTPGKYKAFLKVFAEKHELIRANDTDRLNFCVVSLPQLIKGLSDNDVRAFTEKLRTGSKMASKEGEFNLGMIAIQMDSQSKGDEVKSNERMTTGSFIIVTKAKDKDTATRDEATDICHGVAKNIMDAIKKYFILNYAYGRIDAIDDESVRIIADDMIGWRYDFTYHVKDDATYGNVFGDLIIEQLP